MCALLTNGCMYLTTNRHDAARRSNHHDSNDGQTGKPSTDDACHHNTYNRSHCRVPQVWHHQEIRETQLLCSWWFLVQELWRRWRLKV